MGASAPQAPELRDLLALADESERRQWRDLPLGYASSQGNEYLRRVIAASHPGLEADDILVFAGALEAMYVFYHALLEPGDRVQVITPIFEPLAILPQAMGARLELIPLQTEDNSWRLDQAQWQDRLRPDTKLAAINFPHNPTGAMIDAEQLGAMVDSCREHDCWLFSDEVFRGLEYHPEESLPPVASLYEKGVSLGVMSKAHGLGGVRVGWIACRDRALLRRMLEIKDFLSICNGQTDEMLAAIALNHGEALLANNRQLAQENLLIIHAGLAASQVPLRWHRPLAGCVAYPELVAEPSARRFAERLLAKTGIMVVPGYCFLQGKSHIRIGFGRKDFQKTFERFLAFL